MSKATNRRKSEAQILKEIFDIKLYRHDSKIPVKFLDMNRGITPSHVSEIAVSLDDMGFVRPIVMFNINLPEHNLIGLYAGDGQHTFTAALRLGLDIPYIEKKIDTIEQLVKRLAMLNNTSKPWGLCDYVQTWSFIYDDYRKLAKYREIYDLELSCIAGILHESPSIFSSFNVIKDGTFRIKNEDKAVMYLDYVSDFIKTIPKLERGFGRRIINAYHFFLINNIDKYNHQKFIKNLKKRTDSLQDINSEDFTSFFEKFM